MKPQVSFVVINRDGGPFDATWRAIEAQDLPADRLDVHVISPVSGHEPEIPVPSGETIVFLASPVIPAPDLGRLAHQRLGDVDDASSTVLQGRVLAAEGVTDPVSRRVIEASGSDFTRVTDPENLPFHWIDPRCLALPADLYARIGETLVRFALARRATRARLGHTLTRTHGVRLRVRPLLRVQEPCATTVDAALEAARLERADRFALSTGDPELRHAFGIPELDELRTEDPAEHRRRVERLAAIARELARLDLPRVLGHQPTDLAAGETIERLTDDVLRRAMDSIARMTWAVAATEIEAFAPEAPPTPAGSTGAIPPATGMTPGVTPPATTARIPRELAPEPAPAPEPELMSEPEPAPEPAQAPEPEVAREPERAPEPDTPGEPELTLDPRPAPMAATAAPHEAGAQTPSLSLTPGDQLFAQESAAAAPPAPALSIVIVATDAANTLPECLAAIDAHTDIDHEIIVVDNASIDETAQIARTHGSVEMVVPVTEPVGFGEGANLGARVARGSHLAFLEPEAVPGPGWASALLSSLGDGIAAAAPVSNGLPGAQSLVRWLDRFTVLDDITALVTSLRERAAATSRTHDVKWIQPLCIVIPRRVITEIGSFDRQIRTPDAATLELSLRATRSGRRLVVTTDAFVARAGGLRRPRLLAARAEVTDEPSERDAERMREEARADIGRLRAIAGTGEEVPASRDLWGVDWTGVDAPPVRSPRLSIVIPVCNQIDFTKACLESLRAGTFQDMEIVVVDNGSTDGTPEYLATRDDVVLVRNDRNHGFAPAVNQGLARARGRDLLVLNNDVIVPRRMIERLVETLDVNPSFGMIGPVTNSAAPSQLVQASYEDVDDLDAFADARWRQHGAALRPEAVVLGLAMLMRREVLDTVGGFDERFEVGNFEDNDFSLRATVGGFRLGVADGVYIHHFGGRTFEGEGFDYSELTRTNHARFVEKWQTKAAEPATASEIDAGTTEEDPSLASPATDAPGWLPLDAGAPPPPPETTRRWAESGEGTPGETVAAAASGTDGEPALAPGDIYLVANDRLEKGRFEEAEELFGWAIERMPEMVLAHMGRGLALARLGRLEEAASALEHTVRLDPTLSEGHNNLGVIYFMMGRDDQARRALGRGIELDPDNADARANLDEIDARARHRSHASA